MKSEEIKIEISNLKEWRDRIIKDISDKRNELFNALADEAGLVRGDKVTLYKNGNEIGAGFFGCFIEKYGRISADVKKAKKDGTASLNCWSTYDFDRIEKAEKQPTTE